MRKDGPPKLGKTDRDGGKKFNLENLKGKAIEIKEKSTGTSSNIGPRPPVGSRPPKLGKTDSDGFDFNNLISKFSVLNDKKLILAAVVLIVTIGALAAFGGGGYKPISNHTNNTTVPVASLQNHYDNGKISFDYPKDWNVSNQKVQAPLIVTVEKDENNSFSVFSENLGTTSFSDRVQQWRQNIIQNGAITYEGSIAMDGVAGYNIEATYQTQNGTYNTRGIAIPKNNTAYFVIFIYNTSPLNYKDVMDLVLNSFHVK